MCRSFACQGPFCTWFQFYFHLSFCPLFWLFVVVSSAECGAEMWARAASYYRRYSIMIRAHSLHCTNTVTVYAVYITCIALAIVSHCVDACGCYNNAYIQCPLAVTGGQWRVLGNTRCEWFAVSAGFIFISRFSSPHRHLTVRHSKQNSLKMLKSRTIETDSRCNWDRV